ncbi:hypothetical protein [Bacillus manliponensis]|uniref:Uncharacterized protein n=1 Tax=Bacillus manliponensis TaxID=574376 RepID=A0A073K0V4_9BACI|nr:hypothetical protein [Bacillus manliponensis]KEK20077.1 hypothetical protein BAMA_16610 [Bacillus manliponensis]
MKQHVKEFMKRLQENILIQILGLLGIVGWIFPDEMIRKHFFEIIIILLLLFIIFLFIKKEKGSTDV